MPKKTFDPKKVGYKYKKELAAQFYEMSKQGLLLHQIAELVNIPEKFLIKWSKDAKYKDFGRAYSAGQTACHAFWTQKLMEAQNRTDIDKATTILKTWFKDWNIAAKTETKVESKLEKMTDEEIAKSVEYAAASLGLTKPSSKNDKPDLKIVEGTKK